MVPNKYMIFYDNKCINLVGLMDFTKCYMNKLSNPMLVMKSSISSLHNIFSKHSVTRTCFYDNQIQRSTCY